MVNRAEEILISITGLHASNISDIKNIYIVPLVHLLCVSIFIITNCCGLNCLGYCFLLRGASCRCWICGAVYVLDSVIVYLIVYCIIIEEPCEGHLYSVFV